MNRFVSAVAAFALAAGVFAPQAANAAPAAAAPAPATPVAAATGEYDYYCIGVDGSSYMLRPGQATTDCHGSYLKKYINGNQVASYHLAYGGGAAQTVQWNTGCVLAVASGVALFVYPPSGATAWIVQGALTSAGLYVSCKA
ncbi:hypothetical protein JIG36_08455 [Actinoplanes sp. LDG1-06]|uniref:Secreted protein n=1 Tax=Paractinoplanes ovalisporus TaxID=2810368 RepID=A0ABS2A6Y8_9ACTN|nr:hypothetical protein [Actinoplanes ovalisporus]MBM2615595.1 hypothetical protein [Actinoplanes ovalisporus]